MADDRVEVESALYLLKDFLHEQKRLSREGITLETVYQAIKEVRQKQDTLRSVIDKVVSEQIGINMRLDRYGHRLKRLEKGASRHHGEEGFDDEEDSAVIRIEEMKRAQELAALRARLDTQAEEIHAEREKRTSDITFWSRQRWLWFGAFFLAITAAIMSGCTGFIVWKITQSQGQK